MFISKKNVPVVFLALLVGTALTLSGCATWPCGPECADDATPAKVTSGMLRGAMGCDDCDKSSSPLFVEKEMPSQVIVGKPYSYTIKVSNDSKCGLDDVVVTERIPEQFEMSSATPEATKTSGRTSQWDLGYLKPGEVKTITITGVAKATGDMTSCTKATYTPLLCLAPEVISPKLKVVLEAPNQALICDQIPVKVTVTNEGTGYSQGVKVDQTLPQGLATADGKTSVAMDMGDLAGGASKVYNLNLKASKVGSYRNEAKAHAEGGLEATSNAVSTVVKQPVLDVKVSGPEKIFVTKNATYKVAVTNTGDAPSANTLVTTSVPAGMKFVKASNGGDLSGGVVKWSLGTLEADKTVALDATFNAVASGSGQSNAKAQGVCCQEASAVAKSDVEGIAALLLEAVDSEDPIQVGGNEKFYITVTNQGSAPDTNIIVKVSFEDQLDYVSSTGPTKAQSVEPKSVEFAPLASLAPGQKATWEVTAKALAEGDHRTSVKLTSDVLSRSVDETESTHIY